MCQPAPDTCRLESLLESKLCVQGLHDVAEQLNNGRSEL
jgi:hypothetical protein